MTRRSRKKTGRKNRRMGRRTFLLGAGAAVCAAAGLALRRGTSPAAADSTPEPSADPNPALPAGEWRAVWVSYLEWAAMDFFHGGCLPRRSCAAAGQLYRTGAEHGPGQVRPFGDALYRSTLFPWSHLCTGVQGQDPGFDPLDVLLQEAHTRGISVEAWVNPYRLRSSAAMPPNLADGNLANTHPEWVCTVDEGLYLNPAEPAAADYVVQGVAELVQNYAVDGIHFDDYFYPATDESIDAAQFAASGAGNLAAWRRENVTALVRAVHDTVKAADPTLRFGISPPGQPRDNDENQQYSDVTGWLRPGGGDAVVDYLCPQVYWGQGFALHNGSTRFAFENIVPAWLAYPRAADVALYFGLGAYRVGWATAAATKTACRAGAPAVRWPTRWPFCGSREPGAGPCTGTVRCSGRSRLPSPLPSVGHWRLPTAKKLHEIGRQRAQKLGGSLVRCCKMRYTI